VSPEGRSFVLAIDHRVSFRTWAARCLGEEASVGTLGALKLVVADALVAALGVAPPMAGARGASVSGIAVDEAAILAEPEYGSAAMARAREAGVRVVVPAERSGMPEFIFEHGDEFPAALAASGADVVKALVRYNPSSDPDRNARSRRRLTCLARWCEEAGYPLMLELLVPPSEQDLDDDGIVRSEFDSETRPALTCVAISELRDAGLRPQWWKLEGQPDRARFADVAAATGAAAGETSCLVLGRGAGGAQLTEWIETAASTAGFSGFAVGRSLWAGPLEEMLLGRLAAAEATRTISAAYLELVGSYERAERGSTGPVDRVVSV
jgi:myo-inositol catabolism protein IolC